MIHVRLLVGNDTSSRLLVGIASFASALIDYLYGRSPGRSIIEPLLYLSPKSGPRVIID